MYNDLDTSENLASILLFVGPVVSEFAMSWPLIPNTGRRAVMNTIIPIPPSQWVKERQNSIERGRTSISVSMEAPVVVNPEQLSKKASAKDGIAPDNMNGNEPINDAINQLMDTIRNPSRLLILYRERLNDINNMRPNIVQEIITSKNALIQSVSFSIKAMRRGSIIEKASTSSRLPSILKVVLILSDI